MHAEMLPHAASEVVCFGQSNGRPTAMIAGREQTLKAQQENIVERMDEGQLHVSNRSRSLAR